MHLIRWLKENHPTRESLLANRWLRPFARTLGNPNIWRFNRKSVARGVALGMFFGFAIPFGQAFAAAFFAVSARANLPVAALCTFISNPFTTPFIYIGAYELGVWVLRMQDDAARIIDMTADNWFEHLSQLVTSAPLPIALGLIIIATLAAIIGYIVIHLVWRLWVQQRMAHRLAGQANKTARGEHDSRLVNCPTRSRPN